MSRRETEKVARAVLEGGCDDRLSVARSRLPFEQSKGEQEGYYSP